jgi:probable rRNA maturation factor
MPQRPIPVRVLPGCRGAVAVGEVRRVARHVLDAENVVPEVEVGVVLASSSTVRDLNRLYRGRDEPTDVLSFAQMDAGGLKASPTDRDADAPAVAFVEPVEEAPTLGEVIVCVPVAREQAASAGLPVAGGIVHLLVHGLLHLLGYDHEESEEDSERMRAREDELLAALGYADTYEHGH